MFPMKWTAGLAFACAAILVPTAHAQQRQQASQQQYASEDDMFAALREAADFVRTTSRPYPDAQVERAADDPLVVQALGRMEVGVRASEALLHEAGRAVDIADDDFGDFAAVDAHAQPEEIGDFVRAFSPGPGSARTLRSPQPSSPLSQPYVHTM